MIHQQERRAYVYKLFQQDREISRITQIQQ